MTALGRILRDDEIDPKAIRPGDEAAEPSASMLAAKQLAAEMMMQLLADCLPVRSPYRGQRRFKAGYNRVVVYAYVVAPELMMGMSPEEAASILGITTRQFRKLQREVEATIASRRPEPTRRRP